ncbi:MAG: F0F1 ATP synthase subunit gamma, partial [Pelagibacteraceae bacterium]
MPNLKELKNRIASVKSTRKITSAMKMVAASKLRRAQELAESSRVYADSLAFILSSLAGKNSNSSDLPEILTGRENPQISLLIVNSSDRGLCGGFNSNLFRKAKTWIAEQQAKGKTVKLLTVGKKAASFYRRSEIDVLANFEDLT